MREVMVSGAKNNLQNNLILCALAFSVAACGVRGPLTVNPPAIKGLPNTAAAPAPVDLRTSPSATVLYGADGKKTIIPAPIAQ